MRDLQGLKKAGPKAKTTFGRGQAENRMPRRTEPRGAGRHGMSSDFGVLSERWHLRGCQRGSSIENHGIFPH
jgi:hypothetical protein